MNKLLPLLLALAVPFVTPLAAQGSRTAASPIVFNGLTVQNGVTKVSLYNPNTGETKWVQVGKHFGSYTVGFEPGLPATKQTPATKDAVLLALGGNVQRIELQDARILTPVVAPTDAQARYAAARALLADALARALSDPNADPRIIQVLETRLSTVPQQLPDDGGFFFIDHMDDGTTESLLTNFDGTRTITLFDDNGRVMSVRVWSNRDGSEPSIYSDDATSYLDSGLAKNAKGDLTGAIADYDKAIVLNPSYAATYKNRGIAKEAKGDLTGALADYDQALDLAPKDAEAYWCRGTAKDALGDFTGAIADYDKSITDHPYSKEYPRFYRFLALRRLHRDDGLAELAGAVAKWDDGWPKTVGLYLTGALPEKDFLAQAGTVSADYPKAQAASRVNEQQCEAYYYVGITRLLAGDTATTKEFFLKCLATNVTNFFEYTFARAELARLTGQK